MSEKHVQWLTYHFNVEYMLYVALEQLHQIDNTNDSIYMVGQFTFLKHLSHRISRMIQYQLIVPFFRIKQKMISLTISSNIYLILQFIYGLY